MSLKDKDAYKKYHREYMRRWRRENPDKEKEIQNKNNAKRDYYKWYHNKKKNDPEFIKKRKAYYQKNKDYFRQKSRDSYLKTKEKVQERWKEKRLKILKHYGLKCRCCGEEQIEFLAIDHINNDGHRQRKNIRTNIYDWVIRNNYPDDLQILCHNCNLAKAFYGKCPHKKG